MTMTSTECRHVTLPPDLAKEVPRNYLMTETEWRNLGSNSRAELCVNLMKTCMSDLPGPGVQQSVGWVHYMFHTPEPQVSLSQSQSTCGAEIHGFTTSS